MSDPNSVDEAGTVVAALRRSTQPFHRALEDRLDLLSDDLTLDRYRRVLRTFAHVYATAEPMVTEQMSTALKERLDWSERLKLPLLESDLAVWGDEYDQSPCTIALVGDFEALGAVYVMEGATLGGQTIRPRLSRLLDPPDRGASFFTGYGGSTSARWAQVRAVLRNELIDSARIGAATSGAVAMFETLLHHSD